MKLKSIILAAVVVLLSVSCAESNKTVINGTVALDDITTVEVSLENVMDTVLKVENGKFSITIPADITTIGLIRSGNYGASFISDGTQLNVVLDKKTVIKSSDPSKSIQERLNQYERDEIAITAKFAEERDAIFADTLLTNEQKNEKYISFVNSFELDYFGFHERVFNQNKDNFIAVIALSKLAEYRNSDEMIALIGNLSPKMKECSYVVELKEVFSSVSETSPGMKFKDFTVNTVVGQTHSIPPQPVYSEVKLSDYVGKGKFILLDFWAPWCGPCCRAMPQLKKMYEKYKGDKFDMVSIAVWERNGVEDTIKKIDELGMTWSQINNAGREAAEIYGVNSIPHMILFSPDGTILKRDFHVGELDAILASYLN